MVNWVSVATNGVRPAFCLDSDLEIEKSDQVVEGEEVYILKIPSSRY